MAKDIEEFLKMAAKRRQEQKRAAGGDAGRSEPPRRSQPESRPAQSSSQSGRDREMRKPPVQPQRRPRPQQPAARRPAADPPARRGQLESRHAIEQHVQAGHLSSKDITDHASHLGEEVGLADDKLEARLHTVFDHSVSTLRPSTLGGHDHDALVVGPTIVRDLVQMLKNPRSVQQAILLQEILKRPSFDD